MQEYIIEMQARRSPVLLPVTFLCKYDGGCVLNYKISQAYLCSGVQEGYKFNIITATLYLLKFRNTRFVKSMKKIRITEVYKNEYGAYFYFNPKKRPSR